MAGESPLVLWRSPGNTPSFPAWLDRRQAAWDTKLTCWGRSEPQGPRPFPALHIPSGHRIRRGEMRLRPGSTFCWFWSSGISDLCAPGLVRQPKPPRFPTPGHPLDPAGPCGGGPGKFTALCCTVKATRWQVPSLDPSVTPLREQSWCCSCTGPEGDGSDFLNKPCTFQACVCVRARLWTDGWNLEGGRGWTEGGV